MSRKQLTGLNTASQNKKQEALLKTEQAIAYLVKNEQKITIRAVAREARVSVSYIYKYPELAYKIQRLREQQKYSLVVSNKSYEINRKEVELLKQNNIELTHKIAELEAIIERVKSSKNTVKSLREENIQLATENIKLKKELEYTLESLQTARQFILEQGRVGFDSTKMKQVTKEALEVSNEQQKN